MLPLLLALAPVTIASKDALLDFSYSWPEQAAAVPALDSRFRTDAAAQRRRATRLAAADRRERQKMDNGWNGHLFARGWTVVGTGARLLSLQSSLETYTGGAHGNRSSSALLWDRQLGREVAQNSLLQRPGWWDGAIRQPFCVLLDRERAKRREEPVKAGDWPNQCPLLSEVTLALADRDNDRRFDHVQVTADPYVAGAYAEGTYEISLPITAAMLARLKREYRPSFEPQPPVQ
jgi:hypothetical protein